MRVDAALLRMMPALIGPTLFGCPGSTEPYQPEAPSLRATVYYEAGGTAQMSGSWGTWCNWRTTDTTLHILSVTAQATPTASTDSARPVVTHISFGFRGRRFDDVPDDWTMSLGASGPDTVGSGAGTVNVLYGGDSGTARLRRLGGGYIRVDFDVSYSPMYVPLSPRFRLAGYTEVPNLAVCDLP